MAQEFIRRPEKDCTNFKGGGGGGGEGKFPLQKSGSVSGFLTSLAS